MMKSRTDVIDSKLFSLDVIFASENASVHFALQCLEPTSSGHLHATSTFVNPDGELTEGVDWNNYVGQQHHICNEEFGAIRYTEWLLNNLYHIEATLTYLNHIGYTPSFDLDFDVSIQAVCALSGARCAV